LLGLGFPLRLDAGQHFVCGNVVLADPAETALVPQRERQRHARRGKRTFLVGQDAHGGVVFQLADEHDAAYSGGNVDGAETPLQALHPGCFVQVPNQQNSAACSLRYLSQPHEDGPDFVRPVHVHIGTEICLDRVDDDQSGVVLDDGFFNSFVRKRQLHIAVVNDKHTVKVCTRFDQAGLDRIAQTVLGGLIDHVERFQTFHVGHQLSVGAGGGKVHGKIGLALTGISLQHT